MAEINPLRFGPQQSNGSSGLARIGLITFALASLVLLTYWPVTGYDFVAFDDPEYVYENPAIHSGLSLEGLRWSFSTFRLSNWHPLTWLSYLFDYELHGTAPFGYHLTNLLLHTGNTALLFLVLRRITRECWKSAIVAALFGLHPLHVESVAWISERKDVLSGLFCILTIGAYASYAEHPNIRRYGLVIACFSLGLLAKPMLVTLPFVLLLLDIWPLGRLKLERAPIPTVRRLVIEKLPLFGLAFASSVVTYVAQQRGKSVIAFEVLPFTWRLLNAFASYCTYIAKLVWPSDLAVWYPHQGMILPLWSGLSSILIIGVVSACALWMLRTRPYLPVGWFWYLGTMVPVIGIVQVGGQSMADRYTYLPFIGLFIAITWGVSDTWGRWAAPRRLLPVIAGAVLVLCITVTWAQLPVWRNSFTLFEHALRVTSDNYLLQYNLANELRKRGRLGEAKERYQEALRINPRFAWAHNNLGAMLAQQGDVAEAAHHYLSALEIRPDFPDAHNNLGVLLVKNGQFARALEHFSTAVRLDPDFSEARFNLEQTRTHAGTRSVPAEVEHSER